MRFTVVAGLTALAASGLAAQATPPRNQVDVVAVNDSTFRISGRPVAGLVYIRFTNRTATVQSANLIVVAPARSLDSATAALRENRAVDWMANAGGVGPLGPGRSVTVSQVLPPGEFFIVNRERAADGRPRHTHGMLGRMTVTGTAREPAGRIPLDGIVTLDRRFLFWRIIYSRAGREERLGNHEYPVPLRPGRRLIRIDNPGFLQHEPVLFYSRRQAPSAVSLYAAGRPLPEGVEAIGSLGRMSPGMRGWLHLDMRPGVYVLFCTLPHGGGVRGHQQGELVQFHVQ